MHDNSILVLFAASAVASLWVSGKHGLGQTRGFAEPLKSVSHLTLFQRQVALCE
jgi:hypothetical protein